MPKLKAASSPGRGPRWMMSDALGFSPVTPPPAPCRCRQRPVAAIAAGALLLAATGVAQAAEPGMLRLRCTNPASGANWPIVVDLARGRVGSLSAKITDKWIAWRDPNQGFFDFERATGKLQLRNASSTGGYFLYYTCRPE